MNMESLKAIISEPAHGQQFYTAKTLKELVGKLAELHDSLEITDETEPEAAIAIIKNYIKYNVSLRQSYFDAFCERVDQFDKKELVYRTAYGALVKGEAMCAGYAEAARLLLDMYGIKGTTVLSKLPGSNKRLLHYVVVAEYEKDGKMFYDIIDPERQANCEKKGMDYERYKSNMTYVLPDPVFTNDVVGTSGLGMQAEEYLQHTEIPRVVGTENIGWLIEEKERRESKGIQESIDNYDLKIK